MLVFPSLEPYCDRTAANPYGAQFYDEYHYAQIQLIEMPDKSIIRENINSEDTSVS